MVNMKSGPRTIARFFSGLVVAVFAFTALRAIDGVVSLLAGSDGWRGQALFETKVAHADAPYAQSYYQGYYQGYYQSYYEGYYESYYQSSYAPEGSGCCESSGSGC